MTLDIQPDARNSAQYAVILEPGLFGQTGLGLPDRDYYLKDDAKLQEVRGKYRGAHRQDAGHGG